MLRSVIELIQLLTAKQRKELLVLQILVVLMAFAEVAGIASIGPFMALIGNIDILQQDNFLAKIYQQSGLKHPNDFIFWAGIAAFSTLAISAVISIFTLWRMAIFGSKVGIEMGDRLFEYYMHQPWLFHASGSTAILNKKISSDTSAVMGLIIQPLLTMNSRIAVAAFIAIPILVFKPLVAIVGLGIFGIAYLGLYRLVRNQLERNGLAISHASGKRYSLMAEGFGGIKDVLLLGRQRNFVERFNASGAEISYGQGTNQTITQAPRYIMEVVAFGAIIFLVSYLVKSYQGNLGAILPTLAVYALAGFKLLPAFQNIYLSIANIKSGLPALNEIKEELKASKEKPLANTIIKSAITENIIPKNSIILKNIEFTYPGKTMPALTQLNMVIPAKKVVGIVGATGSGKSTAIDLILGLIQPASGELLVDNKAITQEQLPAWQNSLGFVPQSIYLANSTMRENVAFGLPPELIDEQRVKQAIKLAHLEELVDQLPDGINTIVGERGVQLSGGQRQRIGIARSLYHDAEVLILDEATSALDGITEKFIMEAIHDFSGNKTIIMIAHRFTTVQKCDIIYLMDQGRVVDQGTYNELFERNTTFKRMAQHA